MPNDALNVGSVAPDFSLMNQDLHPVHLADYRGKRKVMLLFYPMDFSPICTTEHCTFGPELNEKLKDADTVIFGINADHPFSHAEFRRKHDIPYDLLSDPTRKTLKAYGMFAGEEPFNCAKRGTVVIDKSGKVSFYQVNQIEDVRTLEELASASLYDLEMTQRANEFGEST